MEKNVIYMYDTGVSHNSYPVSCSTSVHATHYSCYHYSHSPFSLFTPQGVPPTHDVAALPDEVLKIRVAALVGDLRQSGLLAAEGLVQVKQLQGRVGKLPERRREDLTSHEIKMTLEVYREGGEALGTPEGRSDVTRE